MEVSHQETFWQWIRLAPLFVAGGMVAAIILHIAFNLSTKQILGPLSVLVLIQIIMYVSMFWVRRRFRRTGNPRPGLAVSGAYGLIFGLAAFHYGTDLKLASVHKSDYVFFSAFVITVTLILLAFNRKWKVIE